MEKITFYYPRKLVCGSGALDQFADDFVKTGNKKLFLLTIQPVADLLEATIKKFNAQGIEVSIDISICNEPSFSDFSKLLEKAKGFKTDSVVGIGGGSVMDTAKLVAAQLTGDQSTQEIVGNGLIKGRDIYLACLPTTSGTGSEVSPNAIFTDNEDNGKKGVISPYLVPDAAYVDPSLSFGVPSAITAATGMDALTHCLEAYTNKHAHPMVDLIALEGIRLIGESLMAAVNDGKNEEARSQLALGSLYGGMCLGPVNTAAVHALAYPLGSIYKVAHGLSNALMLPYVMEYNLDSCKEKYANIAEALGAEKSSDIYQSATKGIELIRKLIDACKIPQRLSSLNIPESALETLADEAFKVQRLLSNNPRSLDRRDILEIFKKAF